jgi:general secretion pathway protein N
MDLADVASRLSTLPSLGSYRLTLDGAGPELRLALSTLSGALRLSAQGQWASTGLRLRGEATAAPGSERALDNLLNIIGRRQGARSVFAIG